MEAYMGEGSYPRFGTHTVEVSLQWGEHQGTVTYELGGNCLGGSILSSALSSLEDGDFQPNMGFENNQKHICVDADGYATDYHLFHGEDALLIDPTDIADAIVGVQILAWQKE